MPVRSWARVTGLVALLTAVLSLLLIAFAWPATRSAPHGVPLAVAGAAPAVTQLGRQLEQARPGAFDVLPVADAAAARAAIEGRDVYGAVVLEPSGTTVLTASAGSPVIAQALTQVAAELSRQSGTAVPVEDVVALPTADSRGAGLAAGALPLALGGIVTAGLITRLVPGLALRLAGVAGAAVAAGLALTAILHGWLGALGGDYGALSAAVALGLAAVAVPLVGLEALFGIAGLGVGAAAVMLLGNPLSGLTSAPEMLPPGWGLLGQLLPPGATGSLLRSVAFFDGAGAGGPLEVLACWLAVGLALCGIAVLAVRRRSGSERLGAAERPGAAEPLTAATSP